MELYNHPGVKKAMKTLRMHANVNNTPIEKPEITTTTRSTDDPQAEAAKQNQGFIWPVKRKARPLSPVLTWHHFDLPW